MRRVGARGGLIAVATLAVVLLMSGSVSAQITLPWTEDWEATSGGSGYEYCLDPVPFASEWTFTRGVCTPYQWAVPSGGFSSSNFGLTFDADITVVLEQVWVWAQIPGTLTIALQDSNSNVMDSVSMSVSPGWASPTLNFTIPPGTGYRLVKNGGTALFYRSTTGTSFPYVGTDVTVTGNTHWDPAFADYYYYFYDWTINTGRGRLDLDAYPHNGSRAATLDAATNASPTPRNLLTATLDMSSYSAGTHPVELEFYLVRHADELHPFDRVWVRGSEQDAWVELGNLFALTPAVGTWTHVAALDVASALAGAAQDFSSTFQVAFGQQDNAAAATISTGDGYTIDDISLYLAEVCGDGWPQGAEACDDGNTDDCDGCRGDCSAVETGCGDTFICGLEVCDDGNTDDCDGCRGDCSAAEMGCGDTFVCGLEVCDDGNNDDCDGCRGDCSADETGCGDTFLCGAEDCDDGNTDDCDGCSASCVTETGCGDGVTCGSEVCDDGNTDDCDGCSADCGVVETGCGDGVECGSEECDDGNIVDCDGCSGMCVNETGCGDGVTCGSEECDDGNTDDGDGCSSSCEDEGAGGGGAGGTGGTGGTGGGSTGGTGGTSTGGTGGTSTGGTGGTGTGGTGGTSTGGAGGASSADGDSGDDGGCGCRLVGSPRGVDLAALGLLGLLGLALRRRRAAR